MLSVLSVATLLASHLLLVGVTGCGKTALVEELSRMTGNVDMVRVHVDDQMDSKSLLGAYVCTSNPEEFVWQPGPLTQVGNVPFTCLPSSSSCLPDQFLLGSRTQSVHG